MNAVRSIGSWIEARFPLEFAGAALLIAIDVIARVVPHAPNFAPIVATGLIAGAAFRSRLLALAVPLGGMTISDIIIGPDHWPVEIVDYATLMLSVGFGVFASKLGSRLLLVPFAAGCSVIFFLASNAAVWAFGSMYPHTGAGLVECFVAGLPFFQYTLGGDLLFTTALLLAWSALELGRGAMVRA